VSELDWSSLRKKAEDASKPPEPGWYVLECTKTEAKSAASSGKPMIAAQFRIVDGPAAGKTGIFNNFNVTYDNDFAMGIFFANMAAFGLGVEFFNGNPSMEQLAATLVGRRANAKLGTRTWQGQERVNVEEWRVVDDQAPVTHVTPAASGGVPSPNGSVTPGVATPGPGMSNVATPGAPPTPAF
jgi:hypothetical protein